MVVVSKDLFRDVYISIKGSALPPGSSTVLIFVANDLDALCSCKLLSSLLKSDSIAHEIVPISGFRELSEKNSTLIEENEQLRSLIFLNCGGMVDLSEYLTLTENMMVYIADSHRPINLHNLFGSDQIMVLDDGHYSVNNENIDEIRAAFEYLNKEGDDYEEESQEDENLEDDDDSDQPDGQPTKKRRKGSTEELIAQTDRIQNEKRMRRTRLKESKDTTDAYYAGGTYTGLGATTLMFTMASQIKRATVDLLWYGIISLTEQYLHDRIDKTQYNDQYKFFLEAVNKFGAKSGIVLPKQRNEIEDDNDSLFGDEINLTNSLPERLTNGADDLAIRNTDEFHSILLRHWTLWDSMYHSDYVATKLGIWKEKGRQRLINLFTKMGLPLAECREQYCGMKLEFKRLLREKLIVLGPNYGLDEIIYPSFYRQYGFKGSLSASDAMYSLSALLDCGSDWVRKHAFGATETTESLANSSSSAGIGPGGVFVRGIGTKAISDADLGLQSGVGVGTKTGTSAISLVNHIKRKMKYGNYDKGVNEDETDDDPALLKQKLDLHTRKKWIDDFYVAFDALDSIDLLIHGVQLAKTLQQTLVRTSITILDKQMINTLSKFRFGVLTGGGWGSTRGASGSGMTGENEFDIFGHSTSHLNRLGSFLVMAYKEFHQKQLPLVLAAQNSKAGTYLIVGVAGISRTGHVRKNAIESGADVLYDGFDTSVLEISSDDLTNFMDALLNFTNK
ncbi:hypothetical protein HK096_003707 [Nowakowskiella sp. JEL0078]|nr:hypothetical protein HK096_003707 [Nowakowskiella sp. JEL0078]